MQIQIPYNEVTPLVKIDYAKIYNDLQRTLSPDEMIFAKWRAGFGGLIQWDLPGDTQWTRISNANSFDRNDAMALFKRLKESAMTKLGSNRQLIDAVYSIPSIDYLYCSRNADGSMRVILAGWGYRFPRTPQIDPLKWHPEGMQNVIVKFVEDGAPIAATMELRHASGFTSQYAADANGQINFGAHSPGTNFRFSVPSHNRDFSLNVAKGQEEYIYDLTVPKAVTPPPVPEIPQPRPEPEPELNISPEATITFIGFDGKPIPCGEAQILRNGLPVMVQGISPDGSIRFGASDIPANTPLSIKLTNTPLKLSDVPFSFDSDELQYEVHFNHEAGRRTSPMLGIILAVVLTAAAFVVLASTDVMGFGWF